MWTQETKFKWKHESGCYIKKSVLTGLFIAYNTNKHMITEMTDVDDKKDTYHHQIRYKTLEHAKDVVEQYVNV